MSSPVNTAIAAVSGPPCVSGRGRVVGFGHGARGERKASACDAEAVWGEPTDIESVAEVVARELCRLGVVDDSARPIRTAGERVAAAMVASRAYPERRSI